MALYLEPSAYDAETRGWTLASLLPVTRFAVKLYFRCQMFNEIALPEEGGVLDQPEFICSMLDAVHSEVKQLQADRMDAISRHKPNTTHPGVDTRMTENISIGKNYNRSRRG